ncbi:hypothetical protein CHUAL_000384 [Chamberlinius hualienensis]
MDDSMTGYSGNQNHSQVSENETRQLRATFNNVVLTKLNAQFKDDEDIKSLFECVANCINDIPHLLVNACNSIDSSKFSEANQNYFDSSAFTRWLNIQIIQLVSKSASKSLLSSGEDLVASIFKLAERINLSLFKIISNDLIVLATAVCNIDLNFAGGDGCTDQIICLPNGLGDLYDKTILRLSIESLLITDRSEIDQVIHLILYVIHEVSDGLLLHMPNIVSSVWIILCHVIINSSFDLKKLALKALNMFISSDAECFDNFYVLHYAISSLMSVIENVYLTVNAIDKSEMEDFESTLSDILPKLILNSKEDSFDSVKCATIISKGYSKITSPVGREAWTNILVHLIIKDSHLIIPWASILPSKSETPCDIEWLSNARYNIIKNECELFHSRHWTLSPTWKSIKKLFHQYCFQSNDIDSILEGLIVGCDILAVLFVLASKGQYYSECSQIFESTHEMWLTALMLNGCWTEKSVILLYEIGIYYSSLILRLQDCEPIFNEHNLAVIYAVSLPWIGSVGLMEQHDLFCSKFLTNKSLLSAAKDHLVDESYRNRALPILAMMPSEIAVEWRLYVFKTETAKMSKYALRLLPGFLHVVGVNHIHLFTGFLKNAIDEDVLLIDCCEMVSILLELGCAFNNSAAVDWSSEEEKLIPIKFTLRCSGIATVIKDNNFRLFWENSWRRLISHSNPEVRQVVAKKLPHLRLHFDQKNVLFELCLEYLGDSSYEVRQTFGYCTEFFAEFLGISSHDNYRSTFATRAQSIYHLAKGNGDTDMLETLIIAMGTLAKVSDNEMFQFAVIFILENIQSSSIWARVAATLQLKEVANYRKLSLKYLFVNCCCSISRFFGKALYDAQERGDSNPLDIMEPTVHAFEFSNMKEVLRIVLPYLLPRLLETTSKHTVNIIRMIANYLDLPLRTMIFNEFHHIFCYLICNCTQEARNKVLIYISKETEATMEDILMNYSQSIYNELMLHLGCNFNESVAALRSLPSRGAQSSSLQSTEMFLGFLAFFDGYICNSEVSIVDKEMAVQSLGEAIKLMGPRNLSTVYMKAMATLRILLKIDIESLVRYSCQAWLAFIQTLDSAVVGSNMNQIMVALLPLAKSCVSGFEKILEYIIVEKREVFQPYFSELYCIPDIPECSSYLNIVKRCVELLEQYQDLFESLIMEDDCVDPSISQLVEKLMMGCRDNDILSQNLIGHCLGKLGAIDPSRLQIESHRCTNSEKTANLYISIDDEKFVTMLLTVLTKSFLGAPDNIVQNSASYAIQEILQLYKITKDPTQASTKGGRFWSCLPGYVKDNLELLFHSRFVCDENVDYSKLYGRPIYNFTFGQTFPKWLSTWTEYLISKVKHIKARQLFLVCRKIVRRDIKVALFLLPYVLLYVVQENDQCNVAEIIEEISTVLKNCVETTSQVEADIHRMSVQVVFTVLDYLNNWTLCIKKHKVLIGKKSAEAPDQNFLNFDNVKLFLERIPKLLLAEASFSVQAYARALMNIEAHVKSDPKSLDTHLGFLLKLYRALDEPDGVAAITRASQKSSLCNQILSHENAGRYQEALLCYQRAIVSSPNDLQLCEGYLQCLMELDFPQTALVYSTGVLSQNTSWVRPMKSYQVEAAWKLASWETLDEYLESEEPLNPTWGYQIGKILASVSHRDKVRYLKELDICRQDQMLPLSAASLEDGSYERSYEYVLRFHMLEEIDQAVGSFLVAGLEEERIELLNRLINRWQNRQQLIRTSKRCLEPILNLRRVLLGMAVSYFGPDISSKLQLEIGRLCLQSAKIARRCGQLQPDYSSSLSSFVHVLPEVGPEQAKWHWLKGEKEQAMICLNKTINEIYPAISTVPQNIIAKAKLLLARYSEETSNLESNAIILMFRDVLEINSEREDSHYFLARYYDRILTVAGRIDRRSDLVLLVIKHFGYSLKYGCRYVHLSMPRLLSLWLEFGSIVADAYKANLKSGSSNTNMVSATFRKTLTVIHTKLIDDFTTTLPSYLFYTAFSQLVSRICHSHADVFNHLKEIIAKLLVDYPQQSVWLMTAVLKSSYAIRAKRCQEIFYRASQLSPNLLLFHSDVNKLTDLLVKLCNMPVESGSLQLKVSTHCRGLKQLLEDPEFSSLILPRQLSLNVTLPSTKSNGLTSYSPFPTSQVYIQSIEEQIDVMASLQKPKKITIRGSDGNLYSIMCKPKDDLRKDCRLMEFNMVVNKFLMKDPESRRRHLRIRTYAVVPLNEECGLIEWVPNLNGLRIILHEIYREKNIYVTGQTLKNLAPNRQDSVARKLDIFKNKLMPLYPPVLSEWFLKTFPSPISWYFAKSSYARTAAVMSMVGYILGLGDRHGENILLDSSCGDIIHVDFNCLFNKGESFEWPELVPFRLTQNMVEAMGPLGYEGVYRNSCETTMRVMRKEMEALMSFLKPFIYDPLVEWSRKGRGHSIGGARGSAGSSGEQGEITNEMAKVHVQDIELRLTGVTKNSSADGKRAQISAFPLSVEGQVATLIKQATDETNLSQMYIGWAAYMSPALSIRRSKAIIGFGHLVIEDRLKGHLMHI